MKRARLAHWLVRGELMVQMNAAISSHTYQMKIQTQLAEWMDLSLKWHYGLHCIRKFPVGSSIDHTLLPIQG